MAIEGRPQEDYSGVAGPIPDLPEIGNEAAHTGTISTAAWLSAGRRARGLLSAPESGSGYWLGLSDAITVTGLSR